MRTNQQINKGVQSKFLWDFPFTKHLNNQDQNQSARAANKQFSIPTGSCVNHNHNKRSSDKYLTLDQYHCKVDCLIKLKDKHLAEFLAKKHCQASVLKVIKELYSKSPIKN